MLKVGNRFETGDEIACLYCLSGGIWSLLAGLQESRIYSPGRGTGGNSGRQGYPRQREEAIGAPSASGVVRDSGYYYVRSRVRHYGPKRPEVVSRELVAISFDQRGVVRNIERFGLEDGLVIPLERRVTDSSVQDKGFLRQLLG